MSLRSCRSPVPLVALLALAGSACGTRSTLHAYQRGDGAVDETGVTDSADNPPGGAVTLAASYFRLGVTTWDNVESADAWKDFGFDIDGLCLKDDGDAEGKSCTRSATAKPGSLADGHDCRDNNFGKIFVPQIKTFSADFEPKITDGIKKGGATLLVQLSDLAATGPDSGVPGSFFTGKPQGGKALLDGSDVLDLDPTSIIEGDSIRARTILLGATKLVDGKRVWSATADVLYIPAVFIPGVNGSIPVQHARVDIELDRVPVRAMLGGSILLKDLDGAVNGLLASRGLCPGNPLHDNIIKSDADALDMPATLPHDPGKGCEAMSIGLGLEMVNAQLGKVGDAPKPPKDPCATGG